MVRSTRRLTGTRLVIHAGLTAELSGRIASGLRAVKRQLTAVGAYVLGPEILDIVLSDPDPSEVGEELRDLVESEAPARARVLLLFSDRFLGAEPIGVADVSALRPDASRRVHSIIRALRPATASLFVHTFRQDRLLYEIQSSQVRVGGSRDIVAEAAETEGLPLSMNRLLESLTDTRSVDEVHARPSELLAVGDRALIADFLQSLGIDGVEAPESSRFQGESPWSTRAMAMAMAVNPHLETARDHRLVHHFIQSLIPVNEGEAVRAGPRPATRAVLERYADDNRAAFRRWMPDLPDNAYSSESATEEMVESVAVTHAPTVLPPRLSDATVYVAESDHLSVHDLMLHVGLQKTGTTTVQASLVRLRPQLHQRGVAYVDRSDMMRLPSIRAWSAYVRSGGAEFEDFAAEVRSAVGKRVSAVEERTGAAPRAVLISNEAMVGVHARRPDFERPLRPRAESAISQLIEVLEPRSVMLTLYVRRQDRLIESQYMHAIHGGASFSFAEYLNNVMASPVLRFTGLVGRLAAIPGVGEVRVRPFELIGAGTSAFVADLIDPLHIEDLDFSVLDEVAQANPSYSQRALQIALEVNPILEKKKEKAAMREFLEDLIPASSHTKAELLTQAQREEILDMYRADNGRLFADFMPDLPIEAYSSDSETSALGRVLGSHAAHSS